MTESQQDRLARKIELAKQRAEREKQEGFLRKDPEGWSYNPPDPTVPAASPAPAQPPAAPTKPVAKSLQDYRAQLWYETGVCTPGVPGMYPVAFDDPATGATIYGWPSDQSYWDGQYWHIGGSGTRRVSFQQGVWWTYP